MNLALLALALGLAGSGPARAGSVVDRLAAVVNDEAITLSEVYDLGGEYIEQAAAEGGDTTRRAAELEVLDSLILRRLISQETQRLDLDVTEQELDRTIDDIARRNGLDRENLRTEVELSGIPWTEYREELRENLRQMKFTQAVIRPRIAVNEDELQDAYRRLLRDADLPRMAELGAIFLPLDPTTGEEGKAQVLAVAEAALARIQAGEDFSVVAAEVDRGPFGQDGGHMGTYREGELVGILDRSAFALQPGGTSAPVETAQGIFLLHMFSEQSVEAPAFEDMREQLFEQVYADRIDDETEQWSLQARRRSAVVVKLPE